MVISVFELPNMLKQRVSRPLAIYDSGYPLLTGQKCLEHAQIKFIQADYFNIWYVHLY